MKKIIALLSVFSVLNGFGELPSVQTPFRTADIETVLSHAQQNNPDALTEMALRYYAGHQISQDAEKAFILMLKAATLGQTDAQFLVSRMLAEGVGTKNDQLKSDAWFAKAIAAEPENPDFQQQYLDRLDALEDDTAARARFLQLFSEAGYAPAVEMLRLPDAVRLYEEGNAEDALTVFRQLAETGNPKAMCYLARMYRDGQGGLPTDSAAAQALYRKAAEAGLPEAQCELGQMLESGSGTDNSLEEAAAWYEKSARQGYAEAQYRLAELNFKEASRRIQMAAVYTDEEDVQDRYIQEHKRDLIEAIKWYRAAAEQEHSGAQFVLGRLHAAGQGVMQSFEEAVRLYEAAASQQHADALFYLGLMYQAGLGVEQHPVQAVALYEEAADRGSRGAMFYLGNCYCHGRGVQENRREGEIRYRTTLAGVDISSSSKTENSDLFRNRWVLRAAKEYGILLWSRAETAEEVSEAGKWMSLAAGGGVPEARDLLVKMTGWKSDRADGAADAAGFVLSPADSRGDATAQRRGAVFSSPYLPADIQNIYPDFRPPQMIMAAADQEKAQSISGDRLWELLVKYSCPDVRTAVGLNGTLLMGAEFEDRETGEVFWAFGQLKDEKSEYSGGVVKDVSLFVNLRRHPNLRVRNWAAAYGHLCEDGRLFGVLTERQQSGSSGLLEEMIARNRFSAMLDCSVVSTVDISAKFPVDTSVEEDSEDTDESSDSILDSILGTLTGD